MDYKRIYAEWCTNPYFDAQTREELTQLTDDSEIMDRFYRNLTFGTGGLRGVIGAGTNRMNIYTIRQATQGLACYIKSIDNQNRGVAIAYDSRRKSAEFAEATALCLNAQGIRTYCFDSLRPTPVLSFTVRELGCVAGIVITASHNPPEYNGYKVYGEDGSQITDEVANTIMQEISKIKDYSSILTIKREVAEYKGLFQMIGTVIDDRYNQELKKLVLSPEAIKTVGKNIKIVYSPLHGTGNVPVRRILNELGFEALVVVPQQEMPDENFSTVEYPNPEDPKAFKLALALAEQVDADIVLATDPDADRLGVYVKARHSYIALNGNMSGLLIAEYQLERKRELGVLDADNGALLTTIVSSKMAHAICREYGISIIEVLTGFKYIGEKMKYFEYCQNEHGGVYSAEKGAYEFLFGFEESYGCLIGTHARDKDACVAAMALCEAAAYYEEKGLTLFDQLQRMYEKYGFFEEQLHTVNLKGYEGALRIAEIMSDMRAKKIESIGRYRIKETRDYLSGECLDIITNSKEAVALPKSDVLYYELEDDAWCCLRPSGTEPKLKFYVGVRVKSHEDAVLRLNELRDALLEECGLSSE